MKQRVVSLWACLSLPIALDWGDSGVAAHPGHLFPVVIPLNILIPTRSSGPGKLGCSRGASISRLGPLAGPYHEGFYTCRRRQSTPPGRPYSFMSYRTVPLLLGGCLALLRRRTVGGLRRCEWVRPSAAGPSNPARHQRFLGGFQHTGCWVLVEVNQEKWVEHAVTIRVVVGCYPVASPLANGGRAGRPPHGGSGAFTRSSGLP